jgi:hypothetical protein
MSSERLSVESEIRELEDMIAAIPEERVIERMSLESRLQSARKILAELPDAGTASRARLTFRGRPVFGSHGIAADFGAKAAGAFSDAYAMVAAGLSEGLEFMGPIPNRNRNQLLITGTAMGSFGFEFELPPTLAPGFDESEMAMRKMEELFRLAAEGSDDDIAEVIDEIHPRSVKKVYEFLALLEQQQAWCGLEFGEHSFRFADHAQLKASAARLKDDNIHESNGSYRGEIQGVLPTGRTFEFKLLDQEELIRGKVDSSISDPDVLNREWLHRPATITLSVMQVGQGRPKYTLKSLDDLVAEAAM